MPPTRPLCEAPHCQIRNRHKTDCPYTDCWGCLNRPAADGSRLCLVDTARIQTDAARCAVLYRDLELVLIGGSAAGEHIATTGGGPPAPDDDVMAARDRIRYVLERTAALIASQRGLTAPDDRIPALARYVAVHREWLAANTAGVKVAVALRELAGDSQLWALAYPAGSNRLYLGDCPCPIDYDDGSEGTCGTRLYQYPDQPLITCDGCGVAETVERWQRWLVPDVHNSSIDSIALASHLAMRWMRPVDPAMIRQWAARGKIQPVMEPDPDDPERERPRRDARNRVLYPLEAVVGYVHTLWGPPAPIRRKAS